ncbi:SDR family NAD(P)-dependent oxidoreductase [Streptomyces sp. NPDC059850]|uniref:SDR family NAD(P)-dependent oxidoreductase n=1 Tax=Streptomyces sp. NPDC059850 TaxID=3346970 RepID=UPI00364D75C9
MRTALVTGATRGLGAETARRLAEAGYTVYVGARGERAGARTVPLDVTCEDSVRAAAELVRECTGRLDVLVNNAGIAGPARPAAEVTAHDLLTVYDTNVFGPVRVVRAFLPLLEAGEAPVVVNVSSGLGSIAAAADPAARAADVPDWIPALSYGSSKAALNMITAQYAHACPHIRFNAVDPGLTATGFNGHAGSRTVAEGADIIVRLATIGADGPTGGYFSATGPLPW